MTEAVSKILCVLFIAGGGAYAFYVFRAKKPQSRGTAVFHGLFSLTLAVQGAAFLFYYPYDRFSLLATMLFITCAFSGCIFAYYFNTERQRNIILFSVTALEIFLAIWKLAAFTELSVIARLPLNVCNILVILLVVRCFFKSPVLENYILCFGIIAAFVNYLIGAFYEDTVSSQGYGFFYYQMLEAALLHNLFLIYCVFALLKRNIIISRKRAMQNMIWIIPLFIVFSFCNQIWKTDFFFTGVYGITPLFLIDLYYAMPLRFSLTVNNTVFDINCVYSLFILGATALVLFVFSTIFEVIQSRLDADFWEQNRLPQRIRR